MYFTFSPKTCWNKNGNEGDKYIKKIKIRSIISLMWDSPCGSVMLGNSIEAITSVMKWHILVDNFFMFWHWMVPSFVFSGMDRECFTISQFYNVKQLVGCWKTVIPWYNLTSKCQCCQNTYSIESNVMLYISKHWDHCLNGLLSRNRIWSLQLGPNSAPIQWQKQCVGWFWSVWVEFAQVTYLLLISLLLLNACETW